MRFLYSLVGQLYSNRKKTTKKKKQWRLYQETGRARLFIAAAEEFNGIFVPSLLLLLPLSLFSSLILLDTLLCVSNEIMR